MPSYAQILSLQLTPSNYNGYNISCFGGRDGAINLTITGGTPPYTVLWSTRDTIEDLTGLASGYYRVEVSDANPASTPVSAEITLREPEVVRALLSFSTYNVNGREYNISLSGACNGWITVTPTGGVTPYTYHWEQLNGANLQTVTNLCAMEYLIQVTDANGCMQENVKLMTEPPRDDWTMSGNTGSDPGNDFIGTNDEQDLVIKTNAEERLRIGADGGFRITSMTDTVGYSPVIIDSTGNLLKINPLDEAIEAIPATPWMVGGNTISVAANEFLGTINNKPLLFKTNNTARMRIMENGQVAIGTYDPTPNMKLTIAHNNDYGGISLRRNSTGGVFNSSIKFEDASGTEKWGVGNDLYRQGEQTFYIWDHAAQDTRFFIDPSGKVYIGNAPYYTNYSTNSLYKLYVAGGIVARDVRVTAGAFPDYVFNNDYPLPALKEVNRFIRQHGHLPGIPSAKEVEEKEGFEIGDLQIRMLTKIEELTLYIIHQQEEMETLRKEVATLKNKVK